VSVVAFAGSGVGAGAQSGFRQEDEEHDECDQFHARIIGRVLDKSKSM
jgi:hypothetical protein